MKILLCYVGWTIHGRDLYRELEKDWENRDTPEAQRKTGECWALLKGGCKFKILTKPEDDYACCITDENTIWLDIEHHYFQSMEDEDIKKNIETYYLPTEKRLKIAKGKDWYREWIYFFSILI